MELLRIGKDQNLAGLRGGTELTRTLGGGAGTTGEPQGPVDSSIFEASGHSAVPSYKAGPATPLPYSSASLPHQSRLGGFSWKHRPAAQQNAAQLPSLFGGRPEKGPQGKAQTRPGLQRPFEMPTGPRPLAGWGETGSVVAPSPRSKEPHGPRPQMLTPPNGEAARRGALNPEAVVRVLSGMPIFEQARLLAAPPKPADSTFAAPARSPRYKPENTAPRNEGGVTQKDWDSLWGAPL